MHLGKEDLWQLVEQKTLVSTTFIRTIKGQSSGFIAVQILPKDEI